MALNPWQKRFETIFLCSPEEPFPVFSVVAVCFTTMVEKSTVMHKTFAANPAHHWWTCYLGGVLPWSKITSFSSNFDFTTLLGIKRVLKMIVSHRAPSSLNMSSYRAIWTHFRLIFIDLILQTGKSCWHLGQSHDRFTTDSRQIHHRFTRDAS